MAATFDAALSTARDRARFAVGDTDMAAALEQDATYDAAITLHDELLGTAVMAEALASKYAKMPSSLSGDQGSISWSDRVKNWWAVSTRYRNAAAAGGNGIGAGSGAMVLRRRGDEQAEYTRGHRLYGRYLDGTQEV